MSQEQGESLKGVGVLRYPHGEIIVGADGAMIPSRQLAEQMAHAIGQGTILVLPNTKDDWGNYCWDFRIEGGDSAQVVVKRSDE